MKYFFSKTMSFILSLILSSLTGQGELEWLPSTWLLPGVKAVHKENPKRNDRVVTPDRKI